MYRVVNKAVEGMVCATHGEAMREKVGERAGVGLDMFTRLHHLTRSDRLTPFVAGPLKGPGKPARGVAPGRSRLHGDGRDHFQPGG